MGGEQGRRRAKEYNGIVFGLGLSSEDKRCWKSVHSSIQVIRARGLETKLKMTKGVIASEYLMFMLPHDPAIVVEGWSRIEQ